MIRLFVALIIPDEVKNQIVEIRKRIFPDEGIFRWEDNSKAHLTLKFIGEVKEDLLESIINELNFLEHFNKINCSALKVLDFSSKLKMNLEFFGLD